MDTPHSSDSSKSLQTTKPLPELPLELQMHVVGCSLETAFAALPHGPFYSIHPDAGPNKSFQGSVRRRAVLRAPFHAVYPDAEPHNPSQKGARRTAWPRVFPDSPPVTLRTMLKFSQYAAYYHSVFRYLSVSKAFGVTVRKVLGQHLDRALKIEKKAFVANRRAAAVTKEAVDSWLAHEEEDALREKANAVARVIRENFDRVNNARGGIFVVQCCLEKVEAFMDGRSVDQGRQWLLRPDNFWHGDDDHTIDVEDDGDAGDDETE